MLIGFAEETDNLGAPRKCRISEVYMHNCMRKGHLPKLSNKINLWRSLCLRICISKGLFIFKVYKLCMSNSTKWSEVCIYMGTYDNQSFKIATLEFYFSLKIIIIFLWPPLQCSGQSSWLQFQRSGFDSWRYQIFWEVVGLEERGPLSPCEYTEELLERKSCGSGLENRKIRP
jgi:hypothetical protein